MSTRTPLPDNYRAKYRVDHLLVVNLFTPAHWIGRRLRTRYWPKPKYRGGC